MNKLRGNSWLSRIGYGLLVLWIGGIAPLIYFERFSAHQGLQGYEPVLLKRWSPSPQLPFELQQALTNHLIPPHESWSQPEQSIRPYQTMGSISRLYSTLFRDGYGFYSGFAPVILDLQLLGQVWPVAINGQSVWLSPPDKPPTFRHCYPTIFI